MPRATNFLFIVGLLVLTHGITRWNSFRKFVTPEYDFAGGVVEDVRRAFDGDPRFMAAFQQLFIEAAIGLVLICIAAYLFSRPNKKNSKNPSTQRTPNG